MIRQQDYCVANPDGLETPAMLVFQDQVDHNIRSVCELVGGGENLFAHVKTHKSLEIAQKEVAAGIAGFKCATLKELEMALEAGAGKAILSYPQCQAIKVERLCDLLAAHPDAMVAAIVSSTFHVDLLGKIATARQQRLNAMLDLDAGMHRTGIGFGQEAADLYRSIQAHAFLEPAGFHLYDGHDNFSDLDKRQAAAEKNVEALSNFREQLQAEGLPVPLIVAGGSWSYPWYARAEGMHGSPGTFIYWDRGYGKDMPDQPFRCAALVLTQVVDRYPDTGTITTDLGYKSVSSDLPLKERAFLMGHDSALLVGQSEEHGMFRMEGELPAVGDYLLVVPGHACPTTIRYPGCHVIDAGGEVVDYYLHTARDRQ